MRFLMLFQICAGERGYIEKEVSGKYIILLYLSKTKTVFYRIRNENLSTFFNAIPVPRATARKGSSAIWN